MKESYKNIDKRSTIKSLDERKDAIDFFLNKEQVWSKDLLMSTRKALEEKRKEPLIGT